MPKSNPSHETGELYRNLQEPFNLWDITLDDDTKHNFSIKLDQFSVDKNAIRMESDNFPYLRSALINEAIAQGDIRQPSMLSENKILSIAQRRSGGATQTDK